MPLKVLVVDDERHIVRLIQVNLERQGYQVITAFDGREALKQVLEGKPDLVILDVMMPFVDGFEVLKKVRQDPEFSERAETPVIILSQKADDKHVFNGYNLGADMYLTKPFNPMELVKFVKRYADSKG